MSWHVVDAVYPGEVRVSPKPLWPLVQIFSAPAQSVRPNQQFAHTQSYLFALCFDCEAIGFDAHMSKARGKDATKYFILDQYVSRYESLQPRLGNRGRQTLALPLASFLAPGSKRNTCGYKLGETPTKGSNATLVVERSSASTVRESP